MYIITDIFVWNPRFFNVAGPDFLETETHKFKRGSLMAEVFYIDPLRVYTWIYVCSVSYLPSKLPTRHGPMVIVVTVTGTIKFQSLYNLQIIDPSFFSRIHCIAH